MNCASALENVVFNALGPSCALDVDQDPGGGPVQLDHDDGLEVSQLVVIGEEVGRKAHPGCVRDRSNVLFVRIIFTITMKPDHVQLGAHLFNVVALALAVLLPGLPDPVLDLLGHVGQVVHLGQVVVGLWLPPVDAVELEKETGLAVVVTIVLFTDALDVTVLVGEPLLVELAGLLLGQGWSAPMALGLRGTCIGPISGLVLHQVLVQVLLQLVPVSCTSMAKPKASTLSSGTTCFWFKSYQIKDEYGSLSCRIGLKPRPGLVPG